MNPTETQDIVGSLHDRELRILEDIGWRMACEIIELTIEAER